MLDDGGIDDNEVVEVLLVGLNFNRENCAEELHGIELVVEFTVLGVHKEAKHEMLCFSIFDYKSEKQMIKSPSRAI